MDGFDESIFTEHRALRVNESLQLKGYPNVFVGGDLTDVEEEKTAQNAERHGDLIAENIPRLLTGEPLQHYRPRTGPLVISLGGRSGIMTYNSHCLGGFLPGAMKWLVEAWVLFQYRRRG